jgi:ParB family chromosome partitioning protein
MAIIATLKSAENGYAGNAYSIASIPLNKLVPWDGNVRKTGANDGLEELIASIAANGLLQSLVVRKINRGKFSIIAGRRRFLALSALAEGGTIAHDAPVPCRIIPGSADPTEISLTENVVRAPMHPADQFEAFRELVDGGSTPADIAARFGIAESTVTKRLKLARVSPVILKAYRDNELTLEQVMAFAISDDHAAQERVFGEMPDWSDDADDIRRALTQDEIEATDKRARFVTVSAYEEAGGVVRRDLFALDDDGVFLLDGALLDRLAIEKLKSAAETVRAEGWKWVEVHPELDYEARSHFERLHPEPVPMSEGAADEHRQLAAEYRILFEGMKDDDEETSERLDAIEERITELEDTERAYTPETLAIAGAIVTLGHDGEVDVVRGLVRPEDAPKKSAKAKAANPDGTPAFSSPLIQSLTAAKSAAISAALCQRPDIALAVLVHTLASKVLRTCGPETSMQLSVKQVSFAEESKASGELDRMHAEWRERIPADDEALWHWCLDQEQDTLLDLLAFCAARSVDALQRKQDRPDSPRLAHANALAQALSLDMTAWFIPTAANFFSRVSRTEILAALAQAKGTPAKRSWDKLKKSELATLAERETAGTGWLPQLLKA